MFWKILKAKLGNPKVTSEVASYYETVHRNSTRSRKSIWSNMSAIVHVFLVILRYNIFHK